MAAPDVADLRPQAGRPGLPGRRVIGQRRGEWIDPRSPGGAPSTLGGSLVDHDGEASSDQPAHLLGSFSKATSGPTSPAGSWSTSTYGDVEAFIAESLAGDLSPKYVRQLVSVVSMVMRCAVKDNARRDNPAADHSIPYPSPQMRQGDVLDMTQAHRLSRTSETRTSRRFGCSCSPACARPSCAGLGSAAPTLAPPGPRHRDTVLPVQKFDESGHQPAVSGPPKTEAGNRTIPIPEWLCGELAACSRRGPSGGARPSTSRVPVPDPQTGLPINRDKFRQFVIRPALARPGCPSRCAPTTSATATPRS